MGVWGFLLGKKKCLFLFLVTFPKQVRPLCAMLSDDDGDFEEDP